MYLDVFFMSSSSPGRGLCVGWLRRGPAPYLKPAFEDGCDGVVEAGDICTLEPGVYLPGEWGMRVENDYLVTEDGVENLFDFPRELDYFVIGGGK